MGLERFQHDQGQLDEPVVNTALARLLTEHFNIYAIPETRHNLRPDVLARVLGVPIVIEAVFEKRAAEDDAKGDLMKKLKQGFGEFGLAIVYPKELQVPRPMPQIEKDLLDLQIKVSVWAIKDGKEECMQDWRSVRLSECVIDLFQIVKNIMEIADIDVVVKKLTDDIRSLGNHLKLYLGKGAWDIAKGISLSLGLAEPKKDEESGGILSIACLALFDAIVLYEVLASIGMIGKLKNRDTRTCIEAFENALKVNYVSIFEVAIKVLEMLPKTVNVDQFLNTLWDKSAEVAVKRYYLKHDLTGRLYHSLLQKGFAKVFATYFTRPAVAELLASIAVDKWDAKVIDPACGSGTLLMSSYRAKLNYAFTLDEISPLNEIHRKFVEEDIIGLDAMLFASHMTLTNLSLQAPEVPLSRSGIYDVSCRGDLTGSLELLINGEIWSQVMMSGEASPIVKKRIMKEGEPAEISIPKGAFDVVIMNPPFTQSKLIPYNIGYRGRRRLSVALEKRDPNYRNVTQAGLAAPFFILGSELVHSGGRLGLVLPVAPLARTSWYPIRDKVLSKLTIEYIILSWERGFPSFSNGSVFRELLFVATQPVRRDKSRTKNNIIVVHLDRLPKTTFEGFELGENIKKASEWLRAAEPLSTYSLRIAGYPNKYGEMLVIPQEWLVKHPWNWYAFVSFRDARLLEIFRYIMGMSNHPNVPTFQTQALDRFATLKSTIDHTSGLKTLKTGFGYKAVWGSGAEKVNSLEMKHNRIVRKTGERCKVNPEGKEGNLLLPRKLQIDTSAVFGITTPERVISNVWWPAETSDDHAKLICLWLNSTWGILSLLAYRQETRGTYGEYKKEYWQELPILNLSVIDENQRSSFLALHDQIKTTELPRLTEQLDHCISYLKGETEEEPVRVRLDRLIVKASSFKGNEQELRNFLLEMYTRLKHELTNLAEIMMSPSFDKT
jgi:hypothetical protein